jgi:hypothetical protein
MLVAGAAVAAEKYHVMSVALPDGSVAQIQYQGDVAPRIVFADAPAQRIALADPFADMDRIFAAMELQHRQMMQRVAQMQAQMADAVKQAQNQTQTVSATGGAAPANGVVQYSFVSTTNSDGCTTSVQWRSDGSGAQPQVYKTSSGDCAAKREEARPTKAAVSAPARSAPAKEMAPKTIPGTNRT